LLTVASEVFAEDPCPALPSVFLHRRRMRDMVREIKGVCVAEDEEALRYLRNQKSRMRYDEYRRQGLPLTSSHIESTIKQINRRVKGSEKFWSEGGAEALLQLAADYLSETKPLTTFWKERPTHATGQRHYQSTS